MIGKLNPHKKQVTVIGGGVSGLLSAYYLDRAGYEVTLIEAAHRLGGLINTQTTAWGPAEAAAHSILATPDVLDLCKELEVELIPVEKNSRARYILRDGKMRRFPLGPGEVLEALARAVLIPAIPGKKGSAQTLEQWGYWHLGRGAVQYFINPFLKGIYGALPSEIAVDAAFPGWKVMPGWSLVGGQLVKNLLQWRPGSSPRSAAMMAPKKGMGSLVQALSSRLEQNLGKRIILNSSIEELPDAENVVLTVPAYQAAQLFEKRDPSLFRALLEVAYTPLVSITVFYANADFPEGKPPVGVGVLVPEAEQRCSLGILFNSSSFPNRAAEPDKFSSFTLILGGSTGQGFLEKSDAELKSMVEREFQALLRARGAPVHFVVHRWKNAVPQYNAKLLSAWNTAQQGWCARPGSVLFGNYTGQLSIRGMIEDAKRSFGPVAAGLQR